MSHFYIFIDSRRGFSRLSSCLATISQAASRVTVPVTIVLIVDKARARLVLLAERHGARLVQLPPGPRGQRYNTSANAVTADVLVFVDPVTELPEDWLAHAERALLEQHKDVVALGADGWSSPAWLRLFYRHRSRTLALCIKRTWFERVGGFDPTLDTSAERDLLGRLMACHAHILHYSRNGVRATQ